MSVARAEADLVRLQNEIDRLQMQIAEAETRRTKVKHYVEMARLYEAGDDVVHPATRSRSGSNAAHIAALAHEVLNEHGEPMITRLLAEILIKRGATMGTGNHVNYLSGVLSRADGFENDRLTGWHLTCWKTALNPEPNDNDASAESDTSDPEDDETQDIFRHAAE